MKRNRLLLSLVAMFILAAIIVINPIQSLAATDSEIAKVITVAPFTPLTKNNTPPKGEISSDPNYSEGFVLTKSILSGGCGISKLSSNSCGISGYTTCSPADPAVRVTLMLQVYYDYSWHNLEATSKAVTGTRVDLSKNYIVTSGYYYRVSATHQISDGSVETSQTSGLLIN